MFRSTRFEWFLALMTVLAAVPAMAGVSADVFGWRQPLAGQTVSGRLYRVAVPPEVFAHCRAYPADLRIRDELGNFWPFFIWTPPRFDEVKPLRADLGTRYGTTGEGKPLVQVVRIRAEAGVQPQHNQISLMTTGHDFIRRVEVLGSEDGNSWHELGGGFLVDQLQEAHIVSRVVTYKETDNAFLQLFIHPSVRNSREAVELIDVQVGQHASGSEQLLPVTLKEVLLPATELKDGVAMLAFDSGGQHGPIEEMRVRIGGGDFTYPAKVFGATEVPGTWRWIADGGVYRVGAQSRDVIDLHGTTFRFLRLELYHYDQRPPRVDGVFAGVVPQHLVFEAQSDAKADLFYGAERTPLPRYDLMRRTSTAQITNAPALQLGKIRANPLKVAQGLAAYGRTLAWLTGSIVGVLLLFFLLRRFRRSA